MGENIKETEITKPSSDNVFCAQPWVGLQIRPNGGLRPCCMYDNDIGNFENGEGLKKYNSSKELTEIRSSFKSGVWPKGCKNCLKEELSTGTSPRIFSPGLEKNIAWHSENESYQKVEIFVSNVCNLDCIMCSTDFSSKWNSIVPELNKQDINYNKFKVKEINNITRDNIELIYEKSKNAKEVILLGGEPFASKEIIHFIKLWSENNCDGQLTIITNGTLLNDRVLDVLSKCSKVLLILSIDGHGKTYEWIRGFPWDKIEKNILLAKKYIGNVLLSPTIGFHNIKNMPSLSKFCEKNKVKIKYGHLLLRPSYLSLLNLPLTERNILAEKYKNLYGDELEVLLGYLVQEKKENISDELVKCHKWTKYFNKKRGIEFNSIDF